MKLKSITIIVFLILATLIFAEIPYSTHWVKAQYPENLRMVIGDMRNAEMLAEKLREEETPEALFELGRLYYSRGLYRQALAFFQRTGFGGDTRFLLIGFCHKILNEPDSAKVFLAQITEPRLRAWSSAGLAKISSSVPSAISDYPYLINFFAEAGIPSDTLRTGGYTLQFGAFSDSIRAVLLSQKLRDIGLSPYIQSTAVNEKILFRVRAEHFATKEDAEEAGAALGDQFIYMIVPED